MISITAVRAASSPRRLRLLACTLVVAACSLIYELTIAQTLALLSANTVVWYSVTIGTFLLGMGLGSFFSPRLIKQGNPRHTLIWVELILSLIGGCSVALIHVAHMLFAYLFLWEQLGWGQFIFFGTAFLLALLIGVLSGFELPILMHIGREDFGEEANSVVLGTDYLGGLFGAVLFPYVLVANLEMLTIALLISTTNLAIAVLFICEMRPRISEALGKVVFAGGVAFLALLGFSNLSYVEQYFLQKYYYYMESAQDLHQLFAPMDSHPKILRASSAYQKIDLMQDTTEELAEQLATAYSSKLTTQPDFPKERILFLNGDLQFNSTFEEIYHEYFAHVPIVARGFTPRKVLLLGGGDGLLLRELLKYPEIESITHVDLDPTLIHLASTNPTLRAMNGGSIDAQRINRIFDDGYRFARHAEPEQFDAIYVDFPMAADYNLAKLYSREFFTLLRRLIRPKGFVVFDATGIGLLAPPDATGAQALLSINDWPRYYHTLLAAGYADIVPYITTLEIDEPKAVQQLTNMIDVEAAGGEVSAVLAGAKTEEERQLILNTMVRSTIHKLLTEHVLSLQQGFIMLSNVESSLHQPWRELGINLNVLDESRYKLAFQVDFPMPTEVDPAVVNSIMRPTFPTLPVFEPRTPF